MIHGPDVSSYQSNIDWTIVRTKCDFAIVKVTQGNSSTNLLAKTQVIGALAAGLLVMLYHFAQPDGPKDAAGKPTDIEAWKADARAEAKRLNDLADAFERDLGVTFFCFLDVERNTSLTPDEKPFWRAWCNEFRRWSREVGGRVIGFYSGKFFTMELGFDASWRDTLLWCAQYLIPFKPDCSYVDKQGNPYWPTHIDPWFRVDIFQHGGGDSVAAGGNASTCPGIAGGCDFNTFAGSRDELRDLIAAAA